MWEMSACLRSDQNQTMVKPTFQQQLSQLDAIFHKDIEYHVSENLITIRHFVYHRKHFFNRFI